MKSQSIRTERLALVSATAGLLEAEIEGRRALARLLDARVPREWPPAPLADALPIFLEALVLEPELAGWLSWYWVRRGLTARDHTLVGNGGFKGPPSPGGEAEIGFYVAPEFRRFGYAGEAIGGLVKWAFSHPELVRVVAVTAVGNAASKRTLVRCGFRLSGPGEEPGMHRFALDREVCETSRCGA